MKETQTLYHAISRIDNRFIEEAQTEQLKKEPVGKAPLWKRFTLLAACLFIAAAGAAAVAVNPWQNGGKALPGQDFTAGGKGADQAPSDSDAAAPEMSPIFFAFNDVEAAPVGNMAMISLPVEDFQPMSAEESLRYFGVVLPASVGGFERTGGGCFGGAHGVYQSEERGVYYDVNTYIFTNGGKNFTLTLRTVFEQLVPSPEQIKNGPEKFDFTEINGWNLALFRYADADGKTCVWTEFVLDGVIFTIMTCGLEENELAAALLGLLPQKEAVSEPRTVTGRVTRVDCRTVDYFDGKQHHVDESHDSFTLDCGGMKLTVLVPGAADRFAVGDTAAVTYYGEPATAHTIWPGQLVGVD